ncbi:DUF6191 domain-containing protein [Geodermatophilus sp. URMC 62]|uniref:DUF6191 domain-containing protein n=1 Tax=Geodermatophilus sp. URMC 62 TaxID=3423414 RepID=UPI00406CEEE0
MGRGRGGARRGARRWRGTRGARHAGDPGAGSAAGAEVFGAALEPGEQVDVDQRLAGELLREDATDGAPPRSRVDLDAGIARVVLPPR